MLVKNGVILFSFIVFFLIFSSSIFTMDAPVKICPHTRVVFIEDISHPLVGRLVRKAKLAAMKKLGVVSDRLVGERDIGKLVVLRDSLGELSYGIVVQVIAEGKNVFFNAKKDPDAYMLFGGQDLFEKMLVVGR